MLIELRNVTKVYGSGPGAFGALDGVSVIVERGEFLSVIGPSGSGKSTLLNLMAGLDVPDGGQILLEGQDLARMSDRALSNLRLREIGFVFHSFNLFPALTVWDNVAWPLEFAGSSEPGSGPKSKTCSAGSAWRTAMPGARASPPVA